MINTNFSNVPNPEPKAPSTQPIEKNSLKSTIGATGDADKKSNERLEQHTQTMLKQAKAQTPQAKRLIKLEEKNIKPDPKFVCPQDLLDQYFASVDKFLDDTVGDHLPPDNKFDTAAFLRGKVANSPEKIAKNDAFMNQAVQFVGKLAQEIVDKKSVSLEDAHKLLIGLLDTYDNTSQDVHRHVNSHFTSPSTFLLRSAILLSCQSQGIGLQSWMTYTKSGKPDHRDMWTFLDNWNNWVPEAQGAMMKFSEATYIKAKELADKHPDNHLILLKGGFGAGKTRLAGELVQESVSGVVAPDYGKRVVRQSLDTLSHSSAHIQGSQIAYRLFEDMIKDISGTIVYDSSLRWARDVKGYLDKSEKVEKKMVIYDVTRHDMARILSVLKRDVKGDDPRILPDDIIKSAIDDTLDRANCMNIVLNAQVKKGKEHLAPEYHFISGDAEGWNNEKMLILSPGKLEKKHDDVMQRLALEGINITETKDAITGESKIQMAQSLTKEQLERYFDHECEQPVKDVMERISAKERETLTQVFGNRQISLDILTHGVVHDAASFYAALPQEIKKVLSEKAVINAFSSLKSNTRKLFFQNLPSQISYLDLPLRAALILHANLQGDPWANSKPGESLLK